MPLNISSAAEYIFKQIKTKSMINFAELIMSEVKLYLKESGRDTKLETRNFVILHFKTASEEITKRELLTRIFNRYRGAFQGKTISSVIRDLIGMGLIWECDNGNVRIAMPPDWAIRDEKIIQSRLNQKQ